MIGRIHNWIMCKVGSCPVPEMDRVDRSVEIDAELDLTESHALPRQEEALRKQDSVLEEIRKIRDIPLTSGEFLLEGAVWPDKRRKAARRPSRT
jgi:hypothetical protein